jgi:predicted ferric reductase
MTPIAVAVVADPFAFGRPPLVETSAALGLLAFALILVQFALVSHVRSMSRPFGTDALVQFHRDMGLLALGFVVAHPVMLNVAGLPWSAWNPMTGSLAGRSGALALWAVVALVASTIWRRRLRLSYEVWRITHLTLSIVTATAMLVHVLAVSGYSGTAAVRVVLWGYVLVFGAVLVGYRFVRPLRLRSRPWTVTSNVDQGASVRTLRLSPDRHAGLAFEPGQFVWLVTGTSPFSLQEHPLSISSSAERPDDGFIELSVKALGDWSGGVVPRLAPGTAVWVDGAFGGFTTEGKAAQGFVLIAGGIGIAPMRSMILTMRDRGDRRHVILFMCAHDESRMPFRDEFARLRTEMNLDVVEVFETPSPDWNGERGHLTPDVLRRHLPVSFQRYHYFVCGPPPMMDAVEAMLLAAGVAPRSIDSERFEVA